MVARITNSQRWQRIFYFFPLQLFFLHLQRSLFLIIFWAILFGVITRSFGNKFGIPYLFLAPEYKGEVGIWSFAILGFAVGGFIMAFNIYAYIRNAHRFPFLGTLSRPFFKFCVNNSLIPIIFVGVYLYCSAQFLAESELKSSLEIFRDLSAFLMGNTVFILIAFLYFFPTNKSIHKITGQTEEEIEQALKRKNISLRRNYRWYLGGRHQTKWRIDTYLAHPFKIALARDSSHYDVATLRRVFVQNHVNASLFELLIIAAFVVVGAFQFNSFFVIPAAASGFLVCTAIIMVVSIIMSYLREWAFPVIIILLVLINQASVKYDVLNATNPAYGLDYSVEKVPYNNANINRLNSDVQKVRSDMDVQEAILNRWLDKERKRTGNPGYKPLMVILNTSGGGQRSTLFTMQSLQVADSLTDGAVFRNMRLLTGSSGGTIGAAYYRELYMRQDSLPYPLYSQHYLDNASKDLLNRVLFTLATNDVFVRFRKKTIAGYRYTIDRAMTFESQLNKNTGFVLNKRVMDYAEAEALAEIPMMVLSPSVVNDGRRMLISAQPISYLCYEDPDLMQGLNLGFENVEFNRMFAAHDAQNLLLTSALRMNSTFPYILPYATLPTAPPIEVMDAGLRDNFGTKVTAQYLLTFRHWIERNTRGVLILQIRDVEKRFEPTGSEMSILEKLLNPIGSFYSNLFTDQDYNMDQLMRTASDCMKFPVHQVPLEIMRYPDENISLSWHLSALEKQRVLQSLDFQNNRESLQRIRTLLAD